MVYVFWVLFEFIWRLLLLISCRTRLHPAQWYALAAFFNCSLQYPAVRKRVSFYAEMTLTLWRGRTRKSGWGMRRGGGCWQGGEGRPAIATRTRVRAHAHTPYHAPLRTRGGGWGLRWAERAGGRSGGGGGPCRLTCLQVSSFQSRSSNPMRT
jgi:hypothetical protein